MSGLKILGIFGAIGLVIWAVIAMPRSLLAFIGFVGVWLAIIGVIIYYGWVRR